MTETREERARKHNEERQATLRAFVAKHKIACFACGTIVPEYWAKTGISKVGPWAICVPCVNSRPRPASEPRERVVYREKIVYRDAPPLAPEFLLDLIKLCHPDRHPDERFPLANETTRKLLDLYRKAVEE